MYHTCFICHVSIHVSKVLHVLRRSCTKYVWLLKSVQSSRVGSITTYQNNSEHLSNSLDECSDSDCTSLNFNLCCSPSMSSGKWWYPWDGWPLNNQPHTKPFKKKNVYFIGYLGISSCIRLPVAQQPHLAWPHPKRTIFTLPNSDVYDSPGSVMVAFDQAVVPGMDNRTVELIKWLGMHVSYVTNRDLGRRAATLKGTAMFGNESGISRWRWNLMPFKARLSKNEAKNGVHEVYGRDHEKMPPMLGKIQLDTTIYAKLKGFHLQKCMKFGNRMTPGVKSFRAVHHFNMF